MRLKPASPDRSGTETPGARLRRLGVASEGVAAVEFALILPVMVLMYCGMTDLVFALSNDHKLTTLSRTLSDLVGRSTNLTDDDLKGIFAASSTVMQPFEADNVNMVVSSIAVKYVSGTSGPVKGVVCWSNKGTKDAIDRGLSPGASYPIPDGFDTPNTSFIVAETKTHYVPLFGYVLVGGKDLEETTAWPVRNVKEVTRNGKGCLT